MDTSPTPAPVHAEDRPRPAASVFIVGTLCAALVLGACIVEFNGPDFPDPPPFPPELPTEATLHDGLVLRASGQVVSTSPTVIRVTATLENPTAEAITTEVAAGDCQVIAVAYSAVLRTGQTVEPPNGVSPVHGGCLNVAGSVELTVPAGATVSVGDPAPEFPLRQRLEEMGIAYAPGRFIISARVATVFVFEVVALDVEVTD